MTFVRCRPCGVLAETPGRCPTCDEWMEPVATPIEENTVKTIPCVDWPDVDLDERERRTGRPVTRPKQRTRKPA